MLSFKRRANKRGLIEKGDFKRICSNVFARCYRLNYSELYRFNTFIRVLMVAVCYKWLHKL